MTFVVYSRKHVGFLLEYLVCVSLQESNIITVLSQLRDHKIKYKQLGPRSVYPLCVVYSKPSSEKYRFAWKKLG